MSLNVRKSLRSRGQVRAYIHLGVLCVRQWLCAARVFYPAQPERVRYVIHDVLKQSKAVRRVSADWSYDTVHRSITDGGSPPCIPVVIRN